MKKLLFIIFAAALLLPVAASAKLKAPDVLDNEKISTDESLSRYKSVGIRPFTYDNIEYSNVDDEEMRKMKKFLRDCQDELAKSVRRGLEDEGVKAVILDEEGGEGKADVILEGEFKEINLGNAVARIGWGFGAGQAGIKAEGKLVDAKSGEELASFEHENSSGFGDGNKWSLVLHECEDLGDKLTEFIMKLRK